MNPRQVRLDALSQVMQAIGNMDADLPADSEPGMLGTDTRRLALDDAREAVQALYAETWNDQG